MDIIEHRFFFYKHNTEMLYIGSCRYMYGYNWDYFPARLYTTREIIYFLENINDIKKVLDNNPSNLTNYIFGDIYGPSVIDDTNRFINKKINKSITKIIMEISSRKVMYYKDVPINHWFAQRDNLQGYDLIEKILTDEEIEYDLKHIKNICKMIFNEDIEIHIIPHLNLKTKSTLDYIFERNNFVILLEYVCNKYDIKINNIGKYLEGTYKDNDIFIEDYMPDSRHYNKDYDKVKAFLIKNIIGV